MKFIITDAGRSDSTRPKQTNDCTVRAYAEARNISYDRAYEYVALLGRKSGRRFHFKKVVAANSIFRWLPFQAVKGQPRMNVEQFADQFTHGVYIARTAKHVLAVVDGVVHDDCIPNGARCVYGAWEVRQ